MGIAPVGDEFLTNPHSATDLLCAHVAEHLLIADLAAPLLFAGVRNPVLMFYHALRLAAARVPCGLDTGGMPDLTRCSLRLALYDLLRGRRAQFRSCTRSA